jgi:hypothetical protein
MEEQKVVLQGSPQGDVNNVAHYPVDVKAEKEVHEWFTYHAPKGDQQARYVILRDEARELAFKILQLVPNCADRSAAIRKLRECIMTANAAIACEE